MAKMMDRCSYAAIGLAMETYRELGPGLDELFYHELLFTKLKAAGIPCRYKPKGQLIHHGKVVDVFEADLIVGEELVLELKVLWDGFAPCHYTQIICYLKHWKLPAGLLFDFGKESLVHKRVVYTPKPFNLAGADLVCTAPAFIGDSEVFNVLSNSIARVIGQFGLGYRDTTYRGLLAAELQAAGLSIEGEPSVIVSVANQPGRSAKLACLVLPGVCAISVAALRDAHQAADRAILQTYLKHLKLPWGLAVNFGKQRLSWQFAVRPGR